MKTNKRLFVLLILALVIAVSITIVYISLALAGIFDKNVRLDIVFIFLSIGSYMLLALTISSYLAFRNVIKKLQQENAYYLGQPSNFYNYYLFSRRTRSLNFFIKKNVENYIIAFTPMKLVVTRNAAQNDVISNYLLLLSKAIDTKYRISNKEGYKNICYCYYHGVFVLSVYSSVDVVNNIAHELEELMFNVAQLNKLNVYVQPYFGISKSSRVFENLLIDVDHAGSARNEAERLYKTIEYYNPEMAKATDITAVKELQNAIDNNELVVYYQPKFSLVKNEFVSAEALVRWNSPTRGIIPPAKFIELAENAGIIHDVDTFVFRRVCADLNDCKKKGRRLLPVSVNFSMQEFYDNTFVDIMVKLCEEYRIQPGMINIEITESTSQVNTFMTAAIVNRLKERGFKVLMDDFGTGYSNIQNLMNIPFDAVKLDRSYIMLIDTDKKSSELVKFLINLCKLNDIFVVAEGVDNEAQVNLLRKFKCDMIQGYYYSKPLPKEEYEKFILPGGNTFEKRKKGDNL